MRNNQLSYLFQFLTICTCVALITFLPSLHFMPKKFGWDHNNQRLLELAILGFTLLASIFNGSTLHFKYPKYIDYACYTLIILAGFSSFFAQSPRHAIIETCLFIGLIYFSILIARLYVNDRNIFIKRLTYALWGSVFLYLVAFYVGYISAIISHFPLKWPKPITGFSGMRSFNQYQLWSLGLLSLPLLTSNLNTKLRYGLYIALTLWWVLLFYSTSRGVLLAWLIGVISIAAIYQKSAWPFLRSQLVSFATGGCFYFILFKLAPVLNGSSIVTGTLLRESTSDRLDLWHLASLLIKSSPALGVGPMHYAWNSSISAHPHNSVLQIASEFGIPSTLIIITIITYAFRCWIKKFNLEKVKANNTDIQLAIILLFTLITNAAYSLVDGVIVMPMSQVMMFIVIGIALGHYFYQGKSKIVAEVSNNNQQKLIFSRVFAGVILILTVWSATPEIYRGVSGHPKLFSIEEAALGPRLWGQVYTQEEARKALSQQHKR